ncbi:hypothetical protein PHLGIDRAFT_103986 [Phlebiopsis gigantea 11061_1 CR5-6]|uniref:AMP-dependent synthetase/ligase domain-containing protein n=1 Tax=Phlebiopsis gigantea (strain 11061_1 CR5-6) TaxID=745531 RepID=A0A0C3S9V6_PHLG1|nr:hypothetical protein PHLGIDRAFT_103986 [Phlebiopsis gigantea 11061_1 CR5-6]
MKIYTSPHPPTAPSPRESLYTFLFQTHWSDHIPTTAAFIDSSTPNVITRAELKDATLCLAHGLRSEHSRMGGVPLARGDVVVIFSPNSLTYPVALLGGIAAGLCISLASAAHTPRDLEYQWTDCRAKAIMVHPSLLHVALMMFERLDISLAEARRRIVLADYACALARQTAGEFICMSDIMCKGSLEQEERFDGDRAEETTLLCYSSGTTGNPKGVELTHSSLVGALDSLPSSWPTFRSSSPRMLGLVPFYHILGAMQVLMAEVLRGCAVVIASGFDPVSFCRNVETYKITHACIVPPICLALVMHPAMSQFDMTSLEYLLCGAAPLSISLLTAFKEKVQALGVDAALIQGYGLTETIGFLLPTRDWVRKAGSIGLLGSNYEARLVSESGQDVEEGSPGELWLRGPGVFKGYLGNIEATKASITEDGWFKTGDILTVDSEGYWAVIDRKKEMIKYKGYQVAPAELESLLLEHPDIVDAGVVGIVSEELATELPRAYVVHTRPLELGMRRKFATDVGKWVNDRVARHKQLRGGIVVVDVIPKSPSGKILRRILRDQAELEVKAAKAVKSKL